MITETQFRVSELAQCIYTWPAVCITYSIYISHTDMDKQISNQYKQQSFRHRCVVAAVAQWQNACTIRSSVRVQILLEDCFLFYFSLSLKFSTYSVKSYEIACSWVGGSKNRNPRNPPKFTKSSVYNRPIVSVTCF